MGWRRPARVGGLPSGGGAAGNRVGGIAVSIGYAKRGPPHLPFTPRGTPTELRQLYVLGPWQGAGVAATLIEWVIDSARRSGADELYLSVFTDNHRARRFYEKYGFVAEGTYAFMVGTHADQDIVMRLAL